MLKLENSHVKKIRRIVPLLFVFSLLIPKGVLAGFILSPISATTLAGSAGDLPGYAIENTINQNGLTVEGSGFTNGDDFDAYIASDPYHNAYAFFDPSTPTFYEWFSKATQNYDTGDTEIAEIFYDLGALYSVARLALWNEDSLGILNLTVATSADGIIYVDRGMFVTGTGPNDITNNIYDDDNPIRYLPDVLAFTPSVAQFIRLTVEGPQSPNVYDEDASFDGFDVPYLAMGEIAFEVSGVMDPPQTVPEPASLSLFGLGAFGIAAFALRRKKS